MKQEKVTLAFNGKKYEVTGLYYPGCAQSATQEREPSSFDVQHIAGLNGADVGDLLLSDEEAWAEFNAACCKAHEEDIAFAEIEAQELEQERMKEEV